MGKKTTAAIERLRKATADSIERHGATSDGLDTLIRGLRSDPAAVLALFSAPEIELRIQTYRDQTARVARRPGRRRSRVLVCGGRDYDDATAVADALAEIEPSVVIHGDAPGADALADEWAAQNGVPVKRYPADWEVYGIEKAETIRNQEMLSRGQPSIVVAFPGGAVDTGFATRGAMDIIRRAEEAGIPVIRKGKWS